MRHQHLGIKILTCVATFAVVGAFDYFTGWEVSSFPLYLFPILLVYFNFGLFGGYAASVLAVGLWMTSDVLDGHVFTHEIFRYWNGASRLLIYAFFVYALSIYAAMVKVHRRQLEQLRTFLPMCHGCGKILSKEGEWKTAEELLADKDIGLPECPACRNIPASVNGPGH